MPVALVRGAVHVIFSTATQLPYSLLKMGCPLQSPVRGLELHTPLQPHVQAADADGGAVVAVCEDLRSLAEAVDVAVEHRRHCPRRKPPKRAAKRPARLYKPP